MDAHDPAMLSVKAIFFDIGDTLLFDIPPVQERLKLALADRHITFSPEAFAEAFKLAEEHVLSLYLAGYSVDDPAVLTQSLVILTESMHVQLTASQLQKILEQFLDCSYMRSLHPSAIELVSILKQRGFVVGAISDWDPDLSIVLSDLHICSHFDSLSVSSIVGCTKPNAALFEDALRQNSVSAGEALHIGDYFELDVLGSTGVGMHALHFDLKGRHPNSGYPRVTSFKKLIEYCLALPVDAVPAHQQLR